jgi:hypothetical protein
MQKIWKPQRSESEKRETFVCDLAEPADLPKLIEAARQKLTGLTFANQ